MNRWAQGIGQQDRSSRRKTHFINICMYALMITEKTSQRQSKWVKFRWQKKKQRKRRRAGIKGDWLFRQARRGVGGLGGVDEHETPGSTIEKHVTGWGAPSWRVRFFNFPMLNQHLINIWLTRIILFASIVSGLCFRPLLVVALSVPKESRLTKEWICGVRWEEPGPSSPLQSSFVNLVRYSSVPFFSLLVLPRIKNKAN